MTSIVLSKEHKNLYSFVRCQYTCRQVKNCRVKKLNMEKNEDILFQILVLIQTKSRHFCVNS